MTTSVGWCCNLRSGSVPVQRPWLARTNENVEWGDEMWSLDSRWFDVAVVMSIFGVGNILFGHFEQHKPRWRRLLKVILVVAVFLGLAEWAGRLWAYGVLSLPLIAAGYVHIWWLPAHGINGWTAEPRDKYLELVTRKRQRA